MCALFAGFLLPILQSLLRLHQQSQKVPAPYSIVLTPTPHLAYQASWTQTTLANSMILLLLSSLWWGWGYSYSLQWGYLQWTIGTRTGTAGQSHGQTIFVVDLPNFELSTFVLCVFLFFSRLNCCDSNPVDSRWHDWLWGV